jgi:hypothetical protein
MQIRTGKQADGALSREANMEWNRSQTIALACMHCTHCHGLGLQRQGSAHVPCSCVTRAIFKACFNRFKSCVTKDKGASTVKLERLGMGTGRSSHMTFGRKTEEYVADFYLICKRTLTEAEWNVFNLHYLLGADWNLLQRHFTGLSREAFVTMTQTMEHKLGRAFRETEPFALYPLDEYFSATTRGAAIVPSTPLDTRTRPQRLRPPMRPLVVAAA